MTKIIKKIFRCRRQRLLCLCLRNKTAKGVYGEFVDTESLQLVLPIFSSITPQSLLGSRPITDRSRTNAFVS